VTLSDFEHRLELVEAQHFDYIKVLSSHTAATASLSAQMAMMQQSIGHFAGDLAVMRRDVSDIAGRLERLETFLRSKLNGGEN
jgi:ubiquinone biosynthesis protein UbiJ